MRILKHLTLFAILTAIGFLLGRMYYYYSPLYNTSSIQKAVAVIHPTKGNKTSGTVTFVQKENGIEVNAQISGLTPGEHGFHIHEFGDCACDDAKCAGEHFNPTHQKHGAPTDTERHVGDLGNVTADANGKAHYTYIDHDIALHGSNNIIGRSVIVHADKDDFVSQPTGNAGARVGCGVIGIQK